MKDYIMDLTLSNKMFSHVLEKHKLVANKDALVEVANPLFTAVAFNIRGIHITSVYDDITEAMKKTYTVVRNSNLIFNGELTEDMIRLVLDNAEGNSFNIGICTKNSREYDSAKQEYEMLKTYLVRTYDMNVDTIEDKVDGYSAYVLSYRHK